MEYDSDKDKSAGRYRCFDQAVCKRTGGCVCIARPCSFGAAVASHLLKAIAAGAAAPPLTPQGRANTPPGIIKYAFWRRTAANPNAVYCCLNLGEASAPEEIAPRSICFDRDIREVDGESIILRIDPLLYARPRSGAFFFFGFGTAVTGRSARTTAAASPGLSTSRI